MKSKEEYCALVLQNRELAKELDYHCACPYTQCDWHGNCKVCVAMHRHKGDHIPACLQPMIKDKLRGLAKTVEVTIQNKAEIPAEYFQYIRENHPPNTCFASGGHPSPEGN